MPQNLLDIRFVLWDFQFLPHFQDIALGERDLTICNVPVLTGDAFPLCDSRHRIHAHLFIHIDSCSDQPPHFKLARIDHRHGQILQLTVTIYLACRGHSVTRHNILKRNLTLELTKPWDISTRPVQHTHTDRSGDPHFAVLREHGLQQNMPFFGNDFFHIPFPVRDCKIIIHRNL